MRTTTGPGLAAHPDEGLGAAAPTLTMLRYAAPAPMARSVGGEATRPAQSAAPAHRAPALEARGAWVPFILGGVAAALVGGGAAVAVLVMDQQARLTPMATSTMDVRDALHSASASGATDEAGASHGEVPRSARVEVLHAAERGRVRSIAVAVGARVKAGDVVLVLAGDAGDAADIATRRESIAALEAIAAGNAAARRQLAAERAGLKALLAKAPRRTLTAPADGVVARIDVKVGDGVRPAQVLGLIEGDVVTGRANAGSTRLGDG